MKNVYVCLFFLGCLFSSTFAQEVFTAHDIFKAKAVTEATISPDERYVAYALNINRPFEEGKGPNYRELYVFDIESKTSRAYITGKNSFFSIKWSPDSRQISFLSRMGGLKTNQVQVMNIDGGAPMPITESATSIYSYDWHPEGKKIAYVTVPKVKGAKNLPGFDAEVFEEGIQQRNLYVYDLESKETEQITEGASVYSFDWSPKGDKILAQIAPNNLVDDSYMFKRIYVIDAKSKKRTLLVENPGKLTKMAWSPDGLHVAFVAASDVTDPVSGSLYIVTANNEKPFSQLINYVQDFNGSVHDIAWKNSRALLFVSDESVDVTIREVMIGNPNHTMILEGGKLTFAGVSMGKSKMAIVGSTPQHPQELFTYDLNKKKLKRRTHSNSWLDYKNLGKQEKISYQARDGLTVEGVLIYPTDFKAEDKKRYPLICYIHGGPESCVKNGWMNYYSTWGQVAAGQGYFVFMPNYRASSGRGVKYSQLDYGDLGDEEFLDVIDGIKYLSDKGYVDSKKVGLGGGSYGGYFAALASTRYSEHFSASVMFVGISNQISKRNTTDIPYEDYHVHWGLWTVDDPMLVYDRSPVKHVRKNRTPTLILHGKRDTRVHPSQSLELYRQLKMHGKAPVRLVWYPGEGHGNRNNPARLDYALRTMDWFNYYLKGDNDKSKKPPKDIDYKLDE